MFERCTSCAEAGGRVVVVEGRSAAGGGEGVVVVVAEAAAAAAADMREVAAGVTAAVGVPEVGRHSRTGRALDCPASSHMLERTWL